MADNLTMDELLQAPTEGFEETFGEAWERFKEMLKACPHHGFTELAQIDTFYNGLNDNDQDSLNAATGGNLLSKTTREALQIIKNKSKVCHSRNKLNISRMNTTSRDNASKSNDRIDKLADQILALADIFAKKVVAPALVKAVKESGVTCGGNHAYYNCPNTDSNQPSVCVTTGTYNQVSPQNRASNYMAPPGFAPVQNGQNRFNQNRGQGNNFNQGNNFQPFLNQSSTSGTLSSNIIPNQKGEMKAITTRSGVAFEGPSIPTPKKDTNQMEKFFQIFKDLHFDISFADALILMPKFASTIKSLLTNKDKEILLEDRSCFFDVYGEEITIWVNEAVTFNLNQTMRYSSTYDDLSVNRIGIIDVAREESAQEILDFSKEINAYLKDESISPEIDHADCDPEGDICLIENLLNNDPFQLPPMDLKQGEVVKAKSSIEEPPGLDLKELPSHLEYAYL
nr:hypothetical protein [Tanacetum cinerariifolium]